MTLLAITLKRLAVCRLWFMVLVGFAALSASCAAATPRPCLKSEERVAEDIAGRLATWAAVYDAYQRFAHCDDGSIGEGFSESVSVLLANRWDRLEELTRAIRRDPQFASFVLRHIDVTVPVERLDAIAANAAERCGEDKRLCERILQRARER